MKKRKRKASRRKKRLVSCKTQPQPPPLLSLSLKLTSTGRDKPPTLTDGERAAALYNAACAHASLGDKRAALDALSAAVGEAGFDDGRAAAADDDLASLRGDPAFEALVGRLRAEQDKREEQRKKRGFLGGLFG